MSSGEAYDMEASLLYPINYNFILQMQVMMQWSVCAVMGAWGLWMYNDGGEFMNECFNVGLVGGQAEYLTK